MAFDLNIAANILEKAAAYIDEQESIKVAAYTETQQADVASLAAQYLTVTGKELSPEVRTKMAADEATRTAIRTVVEEASAAVGTMGQGRGKAAAEQPTSREARKQQIWDNFGRNITEGNS